MAAFTTAAIAAVGLGIAAYGTVKTQKALKEQNAAQQAAIDAQQQSEALRQKQMNLDAMRRQREIVRAGIQARSLALATATTQGAQGGSGVQGGFAQIAGRTNWNALGVAQNQEIGNAMFASNQNLLTAYRSSANAQTDVSTYQGLTSLGGAIMTNAGAIGRVGNYALSAIGGRGANAYSGR